jgi:hypothetical protein
MQYGMFYMHRCEQYGGQDSLEHILLSTRVLTLMPQASFFALPPSNASGQLGRTLYWLSHHVEQTHNERFPSSQKIYQHHLHI